MIKKIRNMDYNQEECGQYIKALEEERRKILVFQRELPLCLDLVTQGAYKCKIASYVFLFLNKTNKKIQYI